MRRLIVIVLCVGFTASTDPLIFCGITQDPPVALRVFPDAPGDDHENRNGEYVVITSRVDSAVFVGGWTLCDLASHCFASPRGVCSNHGIPLPSIPDRARLIRSVSIGAAAVPCGTMIVMSQP